MAFAKVASTSIGGGFVASITTGAINTTGADLLIAVASSSAGSGVFTGMTVSDSKGNTWTALTARGYPNNYGVRIWYSMPASVGSGHTATLTQGTFIFGSLAFLAFSGGKLTGVFDQENGAANGGSSTTLQTGSITPSEAGELIIAAMTNGGTPGDLAGSINSGFTLDIAVAPDSGVGSSGISVAFLAQGAAAAINPTWTINQNSNLAAAIASFRGAAAPPATITGTGAITLEILELSGSGTDTPPPVPPYQGEGIQGPGIQGTGIQGVGVQGPPYT